MGRVLRIGAGLMGVLLVVMTAGLWRYRGDSNPRQTMILMQGESGRGDPERLVFWVPGWDEPRPFTPDFENISYRSISSDGQRLYYLGDGSYYRTNPSGTGNEHLASGVELASHIPNSDWIVTIGWGELQRVRQDGTGLLDLAAKIPSHFWPNFWRGIKIAPDQSSLLFVATDTVEKQDAIFNVSLDTWEVTQITDLLGEVVHVVDWTLDNWLLVEIDYSAFWMRPDGSDVRPLYSDPQNQLEYGYQWLFDNGLILFIGNYQETQIEDSIYAFRPGDTVPTWILPPNDASLYMVTADQQWFIFQLWDGSFERIRRDGTGREPMPHFPQVKPGESIHISPDGQWILYRGPQPNEVATYYRFHIETGDTELVVTSPSEIYPKDWSPDGQWMLWGEFIGYGTRYYRMAWPEATQLELVVSPNMGEFYTWGPLIGKDWSFSLLMCAGIGLCLISVARFRLPHVL